MLTAKRSTNRLFVLLQLESLLSQGSRKLISSGSFMIFWGKGSVFRRKIRDNIGKCEKIKIKMSLLERETNGR